MACGCSRRQALLNRLRPGLGDKVAAVAEPVKAWAIVSYVRFWGWLHDDQRR